MDNISESNIVISSWMTRGARMFLSRLLEGGLIEDKFPMIPVEGVCSKKQADKLWWWSLIHQCQQDSGFLERFMFGYEPIPHYDKISIKGKWYRYLIFSFEKVGG